MAEGKKLAPESVASGRFGNNKGDFAMNCVFVQVRCKPGETYAVADAIALKEIHSEMYSTSGDFDLLLKIYVPSAKSSKARSVTRMM